MASTSLCVTFPVTQYPSTIQQALVDFSHFGDIARIDMTMGPTTGKLLVTFFDIRSAKQAVDDLGDKAKFVPPGKHDFRAISIAFSVWPRAMTSFNVFGDIAGASVSGAEMVVEFYDMRAAQQASLSVPGSRAWRPQPMHSPTEVGEDGEKDLLKDVAGVPTSLLNLKGSLARYGFVPSGGCGAHCLRPAAGLGVAEGGLASGSCASGSCASRAASGPRGGPEAAAERSLAGSCAAPPVSASAEPRPPVVKEAGPTGGESALPGAATGPGPCGGAPLEQPPVKEAAASARPPAGKKPLREKLSSKDFTHFDVIPERVVSGEDLRTTVMMRNIPKPCTRDHLTQLLNNCGLNGRYTFLYMPFDKRRNAHCGLAFVNFRAPQDVLTLHLSIQGSPLAEKDYNDFMPTAVSYARLQGEKQLMKHFSLSAVMNDLDKNRRPLFFPTSEVGHELPKLEFDAKDVAFGMPVKVDLDRSFIHTGNIMPASKTPLTVNSSIGTCTLGVCSTTRSPGNIACA